MEHSLTSTAAQLYRSEDEERELLLSAGLFDGAVDVYVRTGDVGGAHVVLSKDGQTMITYKLPAGRPLFAWTNAGTAKLCSKVVNVK